MSINKTCLDEITFSSFMNLLCLKDQKFFFEKIKDILDNSYAFIRAQGMEEKNPDWQQLISHTQHLTDNFDVIYANYFFEKDKTGISYDLHIILKCKTMPFIARFLFDTQPDNFCDKNDLDIFPDTQSALLFFKHSDGVEKSIKDYEILQRHFSIEHQLGSKKEIKNLKI